MKVLRSLHKRSIELSCLYPLTTPYRIKLALNQNSHLIEMLATKNCKSKILATLICKNLNSLVSFDFNLVEFDRKNFPESTL